jgi:hypothetical protein
MVVMEHVMQEPPLLRRQEVVAAVHRTLQEVPSARQKRSLADRGHKSAAAGLASDFLVLLNLIIIALLRSIKNLL